MIEDGDYDELLIEAVKESTTLKETIDRLGLYSAGGSNYTKIRKRIIDLNIDTSHFIYPNKGRYKTQLRPIEAYLSNEFYIGSARLKNV